MLASERGYTLPLDNSQARAGDCRVFADCTPEGGENLTLGAGLQVAGNYDVQPLPEPATTVVNDN